MGVILVSGGEIEPVDGFGLPGSGAEVTGDDVGVRIDERGTVAFGHSDLPQLVESDAVLFRASDPSTDGFGLGGAKRDVERYINRSFFPGVSCW
jgi:hypothetical protein